MTPLHSSIDHAPRALPVWTAIIDDLGNPAPHRIAKVLGVSRSTVYRWHAEGGGPRIACLALFWLTRWGHSQVHTQATNDATLYSQLAQALATDRDRLASQLHELERHRRELAYQLARSDLEPPRLAWPSIASALAVTVPPGPAAAASTRLARTTREEQQLSFPRDIEGFGFDGAGGLGRGAGQCLASDPGRFDNATSACVQVVAQGDSQQRIEGYSQAIGVGAGLAMEDLGKSHVQRHGRMGASEQYQDGTTTAPLVDFPPVLQGGGSGGLPATASSHPATARVQATTPGAPAADPSAPRAAAAATGPTRLKQPTRDQGAQSAAEAVQRPCPRPTPGTAENRSAGVQKAGRSPPARPGTPASATPAAPASWRRSPHTPNAPAPPGSPRPRPQATTAKPSKRTAKDSK